MHPKDLRIEDFTYHLPDERIAKFPLQQRDESKLLIYKSNKPETDIYRNLATHLPENALLVFNNTKVVEARLLFEKSTGGLIEIFCLEPGDEYPDITVAMHQKGKVNWKCLVGGAKKWKSGPLLKKIPLKGGELILSATLLERKNDYFVIELSWEPALSFAELLHVAGALPLPPYLNREVETSDAERYQTVYALHDGSVAAPTAGLHFTPAVFESLEQKHISKSFVTLHVGAGTFKPVKADTIGEHEMHAEFIDVSIETIEGLKDQKETIVAVGTTSLRTIESLYWMGVKVGETVNVKGETNTLSLEQWDAYELQQEVPAADALDKLIQWMKASHLDRLIAKTSLLIAPPYRLRIAHGIITNFHQPQSTLLLLVAAIVSNRWKELYEYALQHDFRFLSYGDGCLLLPEN